MKLSSKNSNRHEAESKCKVHRLFEAHVIGRMFDDVLLLVSNNVRSTRWFFCLFFFLCVLKLTM